MYLNPSQLAAAKRWLPLYLEAQRRIGVPWALLAALHYRESNFARHTARVGGPFQFDPPLSGEQIRAYGARYGITDLTSPEADVRTSVLCAAAFLQGKVAGRGGSALTPLSTDAACADAAWSYNGRAYGSWAASPYVNNDPLAGRQLWLRGTVPSLANPAVRIRVDAPDRRPGVLAVMRELRARLVTPVPAKPAPAPVPITPPRDPVFIADADGQFKPAAGTRLVLPWPAVMGYSGGRWFIRPAAPHELPGGKS